MTIGCNRGVLFIAQQYGVLYIVATPIGNLGDISARAAQTLRDVDFIAAEDTRVTAKLLNHLGIKKPMVSYYQHNMQQRGEDILGRLRGGESCALCSDAGTPAISDPGELLVSTAKEQHIHVVPIPGPCAAIAALCASGLVTGRFCFEGFIPVNKKTRRERLQAITGEVRTMIFYEAPHKLKRTLQDLFDTLGDRDVTIARELTKAHEEIIKTTLSDACDMYSVVEPRGEFVLVVAGGEKKTPPIISDEEALMIIDALIGNGLSLTEACKQATLSSGRKKSELYKLAVNRQDTEA